MPVPCGKTHKTPQKKTFVQENKVAGEYYALVHPNVRRTYMNPNRSYFSGGVRPPAASGLKLAPLSHTRAHTHARSLENEEGSVIGYVLLIWERASGLMPVWPRRKGPN